MPRKKIITLFGIGSFLQDMGAEIIYPIWPFFVTSFAGASLVVLGFLDGLGDAIVALSQVASGYLSDKTGRRKVFIWTGYSLGGLSRIGYALASSWQWLIPFRILDRVGKIRGAPRDAMVADESTEKDRGANFGFLRAMDNFGAVVGITLSIILVFLLPLTTIFLVAAIPSLIAAAMIFFFVKEKKGGNGVWKKISFKGWGKPIWLFFASTAFLSLAAFSYSFLLLYVSRREFSIPQTIVLYLFYSLVAAVFSLPFGRLADKIGRKKVLGVGIGFYIASLSAFYYISFWIGWIAFTLYGLYKAAVEPVQKAFVSELAPKQTRGSALGGFQLIVGLLALPASLLAGFLWNSFGDWAFITAAIVLCIASVATLYFVKE
ncbi:MFS transporter [Candidatus Micrarchaeota archaeon]|nr:MFS transporter [Candidatus Micrarchaeota archaeon]